GAKRLRGIRRSNKCHGDHLSSEEKAAINVYLYAGKSCRWIAQQLGCSMTAIVELMHDPEGQNRKPRRGRKTKLSARDARCIRLAIDKQIGLEMPHTDNSQHYPLRKKWTPKLTKAHKDARLKFVSSKRVGGGGSVQVWAFISAHGNSELVFFCRGVKTLQPTSNGFRGISFLMSKNCARSTLKNQWYSSKMDAPITRPDKQKPGLKTWKWT
ncbi:TPA: hypothetical protein N0F65_000087, partial [Lagenidium giganteum]